MARPAGLLDFDVKMFGVEPVVGRLGVVADRCGDLRPVWRALRAGTPGDPLLAGGGLSFVDIIKGQYASRGSRGQTPWDGYEREPVYRHIKVRYGGGLDRILRWAEGKERLYPSLTNPGHGDHLYEDDAHGARMGTRVPYAAKHQTGSGFQRWDKIALPRRPLIAFTGNDVRSWFRAIQRHLLREGRLGGARVTRSKAGP